MDAGTGKFPAVNPSLAELPDDALRALAPSARLLAAGELATGVAHELNNPLFAILGLAELLAADAEPGSAAAERLALIQSTGVEMRETIRALVRFVRPPERPAGAIDLRDPARSAVAVFRRTSAAHRLELTEHQPGGAVPVEGDPALLEQLVLHLLLEARAAAGEEGEIAVEVSRKGDAALLRVRDDAGPERPEGGLGLLVARVIATDHGGSLTAEAPGTMLLSLPHR